MNQNIVSLAEVSDWPTGVVSWDIAVPEHIDTHRIIIRDGLIEDVAEILGIDSLRLSSEELGAGERFYGKQLSSGGGLTVSYDGSNKRNLARVVESGDHDSNDWVILNNSEILDLILQEDFELHAINRAFGRIPDEEPTMTKRWAASLDRALKSGLRQLIDAKTTSNPLTHLRAAVAYAHTLPAISYHPDIQPRVVPVSNRKIFD